MNIEVTYTNGIPLRQEFLNVNKAKGGFSMKQEIYNKELEKEKETLNRLADKALENGIPLIQDEAFMVQNRKVDELIVKIHREKERHRNNQQER